MSGTNFIITRMHENGSGIPVASEIVNKPHGLIHFGWPPKSPQKGTKQLTSSDDRNPKNLDLQSGHFWFSHTIIARVPMGGGRR